MKKLLYIGLAAAAGLAFFACSKDTPKGTDTPEESTGKLVTITASIPEEGLATKVSFAEDETTLRLTKIAWEAGDVLDIAGKTFTIVDASISTDGKTASFTGEEPAAASSYTVKYNSIASKGIDLNAQEQEANGSTNHLGYSIVVEASDYKTVSFENATSQSSVLQLRAKLPDGIKNAVKKVIFKSNLAVFNGGKQLTVALTNGATGSDNLLNVYATLPAGEQTLSEKMELLIQFQVDADKEYEKYTAYREFPANTAFIKDGAAQYIGIDCTNIESYANKTDTQIGTDKNPYLIGDKYQLKKMSSELATTKTYFKLVDDVDLNNEAWTSLNAALNNITVLEGNGKEIKHLNAPLFDDLNGEVKNLTIKDSKISGGSNITGILARTIKTAASTVENVDIVGTGSDLSSVTATGYTGGLIGQIDANNTTISMCDVINTNVSGTLAGGVIGYANALVTMSACTYSGGTVNASARYCGGMLGSTGNYESVISDCQVTGATISSSSDRVGGFVGQVQYKVTIKGCTVGTETKKVEVKNTSSAKTVNMGGFAGTNYGSITKNGEVRNKAYVAITCSNNNSSTSVQIGGFAGYNTGMVSYADASVSMKELTGQYIGGFVGYALNATNQLSECTVNGEVEGDSYTGGAVGYLSGGTVSRVEANVTVTAKNHYAGGLIGWMEDGTLEYCHATGDVSAVGKNRLGGLVGQARKGSITGCYSTGNVSGAGYSGGLVGTVGNDPDESLQISKCFYSEGTVDITSSQGGGLVGTHLGLTKQESAGNLSIENCYVSGDVKVTGQRAGGILANHYAGTSSLKNCYVSGSVNASFPAGGIVAWVERDGLSVYSCMPFVTEVKATVADNNEHYSSGLVIGYAKPAAKLVVDQCWRSDAIASRFTECPNYRETNVVENFEFITSEGTIPQRHSLTYGYYHHGRRTNSSKLSDLVQRSDIGGSWPDSIWSFNGDFPTLIGVN